MLKGGRGFARKDCLVECVDDPDGLRLKTLITSDLKITVYLGQDYGELYDLNRDPKEKNNLWSHADYQKDRIRLMSRLIDYGEKAEAAGSFGWGVRLDDH